MVNVATTTATGTVVQIIGPVVDCSFSPGEMPNIYDSITIEGTIGKGEKVIVLKKKRTKGYKVKNGHIQSFTKIKIDSIKG